MAKIQEVKVLTFGDKSYPVETMSQQIQALVEHFNHLSVEEEEIRKDLLTVMLAKRQLERELEATYVKEQQEAAKAAEASQATPAATDSATVQ